VATCYYYCTVHQYHGWYLSDDSPVLIFHEYSLEELEKKVTSENSHAGTRVVTNTSDRAAGSDKAEEEEEKEKEEDATIEASLAQLEASLSRLEEALERAGLAPARLQASRTKLAIFRSEAKRLRAWRQEHTTRRALLGRGRGGGAPLQVRGTDALLAEDGGALARAERAAEEALASASAARLQLEAQREEFEARLARLLDLRGHLHAARALLSAITARRSLQSAALALACAAGCCLLLYYALREYLLAAPGPSALQPSPTTPPD
jgi:DNA repair exonuclease SbcCD ATPase subunit